MEKSSYFTVGGGAKNLILFPGLSFFPLCDYKEFIYSRYAEICKSYTIHVVDRTLNPHNGYTLNDAANEVIEIAKEKIKGNFSIIGISQGGMIAQIVALNMASVISSLILCSTTPVVNADIRERLSSWREAAVNMDAQKLGTSFCDLVYTPGAAKKNKDSIVESIGGSPSDYYKRFVLLLDACNGFDVSRDLSKISCPTLVLSSLGDKIINPKFTRPLFEKMSNVKFIEYDQNTSHAIYDEEDNFAQNILNYLELNE